MTQAQQLAVAVLVCLWGWLCFFCGMGVEQDKSFAAQYVPIVGPTIFLILAVIFVAAGGI